MTRCPAGSSSNAAALVATVPITVTRFGLTRSRTSTCASGPNTAAVKLRPWLPRTIDPPGGQLGAGLTEQLRQCTGMTDDRQEVGVATPARQDRKSTRLNSSHVAISYAV